MNKSFIDLFEEQALKTPDNIAVDFEGEQMSYKELNEHSNTLAHYLRDKGVEEETLIPLFIERSNFMITGILGIMKAGCAYVPIDTDFPAERISFMLKDTEAKIIVSSGKSRQKLPCTKAIQVIELDLLKDERTDNLHTRVLPGHLAYVIYTSGSTGNPKGVMVEQGNLADYVIGLANKVCINECNSFALVSTIATDLGNTVIYGSLATGGTLHILSKELVSHIERLHQYFEEQNIDCLKIVPSHWKALSLEGKLLLPQKLLVFGGEALQQKVVEEIRLSGSSCRIINHYGPTETTIGKLLHVVEPASKYEHTVPIGKPFSNTKVLILDKNLKLCPVGVPGQLYITGEGVARGYLNNTVLTNEKFIRNPFSKQENSVMYSTGDMVKYLPDGDISFIGRVDNQVKIRGYRIELGEIENALQQCSIVSQAVVLAMDDKQGNKRLVGYVVANEVFDKEAILSYLKDKLPDYMIPAVLMELDSFPLTANGKIDRKSLPDPDASEAMNKQYVAPRNEVEGKLAEIWADVLEVEQVGINDDFFELGGHSLLAVRLVSAIRKKMNLELSLNDVFIYPTIMDFTDNLLQRFKDPSLPTVNIKYLVPIKTAGNKIPLYIVAGGGGTALRFMGFAELMDADQPVYVLQPPAESQKLKEFPDTIEEIANKFIEEILIKNPNGPYALSGHCRGGIIAFEMAKQLKERGKTVHLLAMFDTIIRKVHKQEPKGIKNFYHIPLIIRRVFLKALFKFKFETFLIRKHTKHAVKYKINSLKKFINNKRNKRKRALGELEYVGLEIFNESMDVYANACKNYQLKPYDKEIVLFYAKEHYSFMDIEKQVAFRKYYLNDDTKNMWDQFAEKIKIHEIDGEHSTMFETNHAHGFAQLLQEYLNTSNSRN